MLELLRVLGISLLIGPVTGVAALIAPRIAARLLRRWLLWLGPVYVKFAQVLSTRADVFPPAYREQLARLRTDVPPERPAVIRRVLARAWPRGTESVFKQFDWTPIAAGTVAQVHRATLPDDTIVAVKILRPGIARRIATNFRALEQIAALATRFSKAVRAANIAGMVAELKTLLMSQTDLRHERDNYLEFARQFEHETGVTVPRVYPALCSADVLVTQFVDAIAPDDFQQLGIAPLTLARRMDSLLDTMVFIHGLLHADLHPGNFFWDRDGRVVLIDLGLVHRLPRLDRNHIMTFYFAIVDGYYDFAAGYFVRYLVETAGAATTDRDAAITEARSIIEAQFVASNGRPKMNAIFEALLGLLSRHRLRLRSGYTNIFLTLITVEGYIYALDPNFDMMDNARAKRVEDMEYTTVPDAAVRLVVGDNGSYSTARYAGAESLERAFEDRNRLVLDEMLGVRAGRFLLDVGCGRGKILASAGAREVRATGITISRFERDLCRERGLDAVHCSWENFEREFGHEYPQADYMTVMEMLSHLGSVHENKTGMVRLRLKRFFDWLDTRMQRGGRILFQEMMVTREFLDAPTHAASYNALVEELPWSGFTVFDEFQAAAKDRFDMDIHDDHSADIVPTYDALIERFDANYQQLKQHVRAHALDVVRREMESYRKFAREGFISLHRMVLVRR
jgi:predicted unusual protein kinase regulating ubiquinone biosynthesis (AarF/ABC1/UbiB family)